MRRLGIAICLLSLWAAPVWAEQENPDPPPPDEVECPEGSVDMEGSVCVTDQSSDCPEGFATTDVGDLRLCTCESGETNGSGECETGGDNDDGSDECPPGHHPEGPWCFPNDYDDMGLDPDGCPPNHDPTHGGFCVPLQQCEPTTPPAPPRCGFDIACPLGWSPQQGTGVCWPNCVRRSGGPHCNWMEPGINIWEDNCTGHRCRIVTATSLTLVEADGDVEATYALDSPPGNTCGPWQELVLGTCEEICELYEIDCPGVEEDDVWIWFGYPRWDATGDEVLLDLD